VRVGVFSWVADWSKKRELKRDLMNALNATRGPGRGLDLPRSDASDKDLLPLMKEEDNLEDLRQRLRVGELALQELVIERPELVVMKFKKHLTFAFRADLEMGISKALLQQCDVDGFFAKAGETLVGSGPRRG
jgi:hypothetical protein